MKRTIVVGDLHGCHREALSLLDKLAVSSSDRVIFVGDLIDRGPHPRECVELAMQHECVLGNHEEKHLQQRHRAGEKLSPDHQATRRALGDRHYDYFSQLPLFIELPEYRAVVVHAGLYPDVTLTEQTPHHLLHLQCISPPSLKSYWPSKAPAEFTFWTHHYRGPLRAIFGHSVFNRPLVTEHAVGIDTGAVFGGQLTALVLPDWELVGVASSHSRGEQRVGQFEIHPGVFAYS